MRRTLKLAVLGVVLVVVALGASVATMHIATSGDVSTKVGKVGNGDATKRAALVFGAGLYGDSEPSPLLQDRIAAAVELLKAGRVSTLIMSGDNRRAKYDEPTAMMRYAEALGAAPAALVPDYAGRRTYDSCWRARHVFHLDEVSVVTSEYHMPRAVFTCQRLGLKADGLAVSDERFPSNDRWNWHTREIAASLFAILDTTMLNPDVVGGAAIDPFDTCSVWKSMSPEDHVLSVAQACGVPAT